MAILSKEDFKIKKELNRPILSLDYGEKRVGIAISDADCSIVVMKLFAFSKKSESQYPTMQILFQIFQRLIFFFKPGNFFKLNKL